MHSFLNSDFPNKDSKATREGKKAGGMFSMCSRDISPRDRILCMDRGNKLFLRKRIHSHSCIAKESPFSSNFDE